jgi:carbon-monoxide dehydrogenase large subunit
MSMIIAPAGRCMPVFLRSPVAHGGITRLDVEAARAADGVALVLTHCRSRSRRRQAPP